MPSLFDPLFWLATKGVRATVTPTGDVRLTFGPFTPAYQRQRIRGVISHYEDLIRMQLDVTDGTRPRTVQQLIAAGRIKVVDGRYRVV